MPDTSDLDALPYTLTAFTASDGENLAVYDWPLPDAPRATVLLVHGLGEHAGRYDALARHLGAWGYAVRGYDHYGHGESSGPRGGLPWDTRLLDDLTDIVDATRARMLWPSSTSGWWAAMRARVASTMSARSSSRRISPVRPPRGPPDSPWPYWS